MGRAMLSRSLIQFSVDGWGCVPSRYLPGVREGNDTPLQHSCLENRMGRGAWWAAVQGVAKSQTRLSDFTFTFMRWRRKWQPTPVFLPGESWGRGGLVGCHLWGRTESDTTEATQQQQQTVLKVMKITATSLKRCHAFTAALTDANPAAGH